MDNLTIQQFIDTFSGEWYEGGECAKCFHPHREPLLNFTDCFLDYGVTGDIELTKICKEHQRIEQKLWELIDKHNFEFKSIVEDEKVMNGDRGELQCPECGAPQNELDDVDVDCQSLEYECSACDIRFKISVKSTYKVVDIKSR